MFGSDDQFAQAVFERLDTYASPILSRKLADRGVIHLADLPRSEANRVFKDAVLEACALHFPDADIKMMRRILEACADEQFSTSYRRLSELQRVHFDAFEDVWGADAAVFLASLAFPVRPLDPNTCRPCGSWARDAASAAKVFQKANHALVGYDVCAAPFYLLVTDCTNTLACMLASDSRLAAVRALMTRGGAELPDPGAPPFTHGCAILPRLPGERPESLDIMDPNPDRGSVAFLAGWKAHGTRGGAPRDGILPVPMRLLSSLLTDPMTLYWVTQSPSLTPQQRASS